MSRTPFHENILGQPQSLARVLEYQTGEGRASLLDAAREMRKARRIVLTGMGGSLFASLPLYYFLSSRGFACDLVETGELLHYLSETARGAAVVMVSRSGETVETLKLLDVLDPDVPTIGVTNEPGTTLARQARHTVLAGSLRDELVAIQTYTGTVLALLLLGAAVAGEPEEDWKADAGAAIETLEGILPRFEDASLGWRDFLAPAGAIYLLARGPSIASANAGALWLNEVAKTPSIAMTAAEFRHGPVEVADADFRGLIFAPEGATRGLNLDLARDLASFGAQVRVIGPGLAGETACPTVWDTGRVPEMLAPLVEAVPLQFAVLRLAEWKGVVPGRFRYVSHVTLAESGFVTPAS